jgi:hypothetical protein
MRNRLSPALAGFEHAAAALHDLIRSTGAMDGALAICSGSDFRVVASERSLIARRTICGVSVPAVGAAVQGVHTVWLEPSAPEGLYLPAHTQVLYVPFGTPEGGNAAALLAFHERVPFSAEDLRFLQRSFGPPPHAAVTITAALSQTSAASSIESLPLAA